MWHFALALLLALGIPTLAGAQLLSGPNDTRDSFVVSGTVVNSVTGEGIARALVHANGLSSRTGFTDSEGHFQFEGMQAGQIVLLAQKPGYVSDQESTGYSHAIQVGPGTGSQTIRLEPLSAISGRVVDASGQPIERIAVRLTCRTLREGRKIWEPRGMNETDEDGHYRFSSLMPGTYYLSVGPAQSEGQLLAVGEKPTSGFPHLYYPGVPDLASAAPIQLGAGQQMQADFSLSPVPVYRVTGSIAGQPVDKGVGLITFSSSGDDVMLPASVNPELGTFHIDSVPAGSYILKAVSSGGGQPLEGEQRISVAANLENVHLVLAPATSIPVVVHLQSRSSGAGSAGATHWNENRPPLSVGLQSTQPNTSESFSTFQHRGSGNSGLVLQNVEPGTYGVNLIPQEPWYVQSASYGQANALYDDITVSPGQSYPLEITLRDDGASLTVAVQSSDSATPAKANVVIVPQPASNREPRVLRNVTATSTESGLAPGDYLVYAFDRIDGLEYTNPDALSPYASQAAHVTLSAGQQGQVSLDLIQVSKGE